MRDEARITPAIEDYLKAIYQLEQEEPAAGSVTGQRIAERLGVASPSVTNMIKRLSELGLVQHERYRGVELSDAGERIALEMVRHHRLLERYLVEALGYRWDEVHDEAERLEHHISEALEARMAAALGDPEVDPHGDPIPHLGWLRCRRRPEQRPLLDLAPGQTPLVGAPRLGSRSRAPALSRAQLGLQTWGASVRLLEILPLRWAAAA